MMQENAKADLRRQQKKIRRAITAEEKLRKDSRIFERLREILTAGHENTVFTYVSGDMEVDTRQIILYSLKVGKRVAVPRCLDGKGNMRFYYIASLEQLEEGRFGILEPCRLCREVQDLSSGFCLVPGLRFDRKGYRLGYGGGYYDRFLAGFTGVSIGLCYDEDLMQALPVNSFDQAVDMLVTETALYRFHPQQFGG